jgi:hypothetical protein
MKYKENIWKKVRSGYHYTEGKSKLFKEKKLKIINH